jgi:hypothetical protein
MGTPSFGSFQLTTVAKLPNVTVAFPGEHWSDGKAATVIVPGTLVIPTASAGKRYWTVAASGALDPRACIALRPISVPDRNPGSEYNPQLTPNDIMNLPLAPGSYVHTYRSGAFHLTLIEADSSYAPGDLLGWDPAGSPVAGKPTPGAWKKVNGNPSYAFAEVTDWRPLTNDNTQGILTVHSLRVQG